jgi:hypothetical protein
MMTTNTLGDDIVAITLIDHEFIWDPSRRATPLNPALTKSERTAFITAGDHELLRSWLLNTRPGDVPALDARRLPAAIFKAFATAHGWETEERDTVEEVVAIAKSEAHLAVGSMRSGDGSGPAGADGGDDGGQDQTGDQAARANRAVQDVGDHTIVSGGRPRWRVLACTSCFAEPEDDGWRDGDAPAFRTCGNCGARLPIDVVRSVPAKAGTADTIAGRIAKALGGKAADYGTANRRLLKSVDSKDGRTVYQDCPRCGETAKTFLPRGEGGKFAEVPPRYNCRRCGDLLPQVVTLDGDADRAQGGDDATRAARDEGNVGEPTGRKNTEMPKSEATTFSDEDFLAKSTRELLEATKRLREANECRERRRAADGFARYGH